MGCKCPPKLDDVNCLFTCMAIWYAKQVVKRGGAGGFLVANPNQEQALALLDNLAEEMSEETIDYGLITTTAERLRELNQLDAAFSLSQSLTSGITMANFYNFIPLEQTKAVLQRNYKLQSEIFEAQGGNAEDNEALAALQMLNELGSDSTSAS